MKAIILNLPLNLIKIIIYPETILLDLFMKITKTLLKDTKINLMLNSLKIMKKISMKDLEPETILLFMTLFIEPHSISLVKLLKSEKKKKYTKKKKKKKNQLKLFLSLSLF
jgi:uncharacterized metal-binding protein